MCTTGSEDAVTVQAGTFSWDKNERPVLEKCVLSYVLCIAVSSAIHFHLLTVLICTSSLVSWWQ